MAYTSVDDPTIYFNTILYTGNGSSGRGITGVGFQPDWVWIKNRDDNDPHKVFDAVRGVSKSLKTNSSDSEVNTEENGYVSAFNSDGFTLTQGSSSQQDVNKNNEKYVAWNWKAGGSGSSNTNGSINSTVSVNTAAGFSICSWTHDGGNSTIGHGLGAVPKVIITKERNNNGSWNSYFSEVGNGYRMVLQGTNAKISSSVWNSTTPTANVFSMNDSITSTMIAYCFTEIKGYSKFGSYKGTGNTNGAFVYTGFKPAWVISKRTDSSNSWRVFDTKRPGFNTASMNFVHANLSNAEDTGDVMDLNSNGFKIRTNSTDQNTSGSPYIYMAFAENPFVSSSGVPGTAR